MKVRPLEFDGQKIRRVYDNDTETWWFSVTDVLQTLTQQPDELAARKYWNELKNHLDAEGSQLVTSCRQLKMPAADGKQRLTVVATAETLLRLVQSVPSPQAESIKLRLAKLGCENLQDMADPALLLDRARQTWRQQGHSEKWIAQRMTGQETRSNLPDYWRGYDKKDREFDIQPRQNPQDHLSEADLIFTALADLSTRQIAEGAEATRMADTKRAAKAGDRIAARARKQLERQTGKLEVTGANTVTRNKMGRSRPVP